MNRVNWVYSCEPASPHMSLVELISLGLPKKGPKDRGGCVVEVYINECS
jgi:hypothetical protein